MSDQEVALELLRMLEANESLHQSDADKVLALYRQCLETVRSVPLRQPE